MINYNEALEIILQNCSVAAIEEVSLLNALGRVCASKIVSKIDLPSFSNSAMDGFAVKLSDIFEASNSNRKKLPIAATIAAGENATNLVYGAVQIMTGAPVPEGYDAVIPIEDVELEEQFVTFKRGAKKNENIRFPGEDVFAGQVILNKGKKITAEDVMLLAAVGVSLVQVYKAPNLKIISTGNEITDDYSSGLPYGKIYNSNSPFLMAKASEQKLNFSYSGIIEDDKSRFEEVVSQTGSGAMIISTGAVSKGKWDFIPESLKRLGARIHFHRVSIRPGKPVLFATLPNGNYFFGLPGNPISTVIGFRFFVMPLLRKISGLDEERPIFATLKNDFIKKGNFRQFLKSTLEINASGHLLVTINSGQESFKISPMTYSNAWTILEEDKTDFPVGSVVRVVPNSFLAYDQN